MIWGDTTGDESIQAFILTETTLLHPPLNTATRSYFLILVKSPMLTAGEGSS